MLTEAQQLEYLRGEGPNIAFRFHAKEEQPAGQPEYGMVIAPDEETARGMLAQEVGPGGWTLRPECRTETDVGIPHVFEAPERPPMQSANDLYALPPIKISKDPWGFADHLDCIDSELIPERPGPDENGLGVSVNTRVERRILYDPYIDGDRCQTLSTLWFDNKPFAVIQDGGRGSRDHQATFITDWERYGAALSYLRSLYTHEEEEDPRDPIIDPDQPMRALTLFYSGEDVFLDKPRQDEIDRLWEEGTDNPRGSLLEPRPDQITAETVELLLTPGPSWGQAVEVLGFWGGAKAVAMLRELANTADTRPWTSFGRSYPNLIRALARIGGPAAVRFLIEIARNTELPGYIPSQATGVLWRVVENEAAFQHLDETETDTEEFLAAIEQHLDKAGV